MSGVIRFRKSLSFEARKSLGKAFRLLTEASELLPVFIRLPTNYRPKNASACKYVVRQLQKGLRLAFVRHVFEFVRIFRPLLLLRPLFLCHPFIMARINSKRPLNRTFFFHKLKRIILTCDA